MGREDTLQQHCEWPWRSSEQVPRVRYARLRAISPTYGAVTLIVVSAPKEEQFYVMCLDTPISGPRLIRAWKRRHWIEYCFRTLKHLLATGACQVQNEDAYYGHLVLRLMGCFVLMYTSRVVSKGRLTMDIHQSCNLRRINVLSSGGLGPHQRGGRPQCPQSGQFCRVCIHEPQRMACPRGPARLEMPCIDPGIQGLTRHLKVVGQLQDRPFLGTTGHRARAGARRPQALANQYATDCVPRKGRAPLRGTPAVGVQGLRNRGRLEPLCMQRADTVHQGGRITELLQPRD